MSPAEVGHRVHEQVKRSISRRRIPAFERLVTGGDALPAIPGLADEVGLLAKKCPAVAEDWADDFARVEQNAYRFLGRD